MFFNRRINVINLMTIQNESAVVNDFERKNLKFSYLSIECSELDEMKIVLALKRVSDCTVKSKEGKLMNPTTWKTWCSGIVYELVINQLYTPLGRMLCAQFQDEFLHLSVEERFRLVQAIRRQVVARDDSQQVEWVHYMERLTD